MRICIIQTLHLDNSSSPSDKVMMYTYVGAGIIVFLVIISFVAGIIYKRFRTRGKCCLIKYNSRDVSVIIATIVKDTTPMIHINIIVNFILFDIMFIRNTWSNSYIDFTFQQCSYDWQWFKRMCAHYLAISECAATPVHVG